MNVQPELLDHPKFLRLKKRLGLGALELLLRLWSHCQHNRRGGFWRGATAEYVETVCRWGGDAGSLFAALTEADPGASAWIEIRANGLLIHDWEEQNSRLYASWKNGKFGGRKPKTASTTLTSRDPTNNPEPPTANPQVTHSQPNRVAESVESVESVDYREGDNAPIGVEIPSEEEVLAFARAWAGDLARGIPGPIPEGWVLDWWSWRKTCDRFPRDWKSDLTTRFRAAVINGKVPKQIAGKPPGQAADLREELRSESDPKKRAALKQKIKELEKP